MIWQITRLRVLALLLILTGCLAVDGASAEVKWYPANKRETCPELCLANNKQPVAAGKHWSYMMGSRPFHVCAARLTDGWKPGYNLMPNWDRACWVGHDGKETAIEQYQCLCSDQPPAQGDPTAEFGWYPAGPWPIATCTERCLSLKKIPVAGSVSAIAQGNKYHVCAVGYPPETPEGEGEKAAYFGRPGYSLAPNWSRACWYGYGGEEFNDSRYSCLCANTEIEITAPPGGIGAKTQPLKQQGMTQVKPVPVPGQVHGVPRPAVPPPEMMPGTSSVPAREQALTGPEILRYLSGNTIKAELASGARWSIYTRSDGILFARSEQGMEDSGVWVIEGDHYCNQFQQLRQGARACFRMIKEGSRFRFHSSLDGRFISTFTLLPGNAEGLGKVTQGHDVAPTVPGQPSHPAIPFPGVTPEPIPRPPAVTPEPIPQPPGEPPMPFRRFPTVTPEPIPRPTGVSPEPVPQPPGAVPMSPRRPEIQPTPGPVMPEYIPVPPGYEQRPPGVPIQVTPVQPMIQREFVPGTIPAQVPE